jgi:hypothetical protein
LCLECFKQSKGSEPKSDSKSRESPSTAKPDWKKTDWKLNAVPMQNYDNASANPLLWNQTKLKFEWRCFFCAQKSDDKSAHPNGYKSCSDKYANYKPHEVRSLLANGVSVVRREETPPMKNA